MLILRPGQDHLAQLTLAGLAGPDRPLRLHLGCGNQHMEGYCNIDYPPDRHAVMRPKADAFADIMDLDFAPGSVDEVRMHHVFEHFPRVTALVLLIRFHGWLKTGGRLMIETPDLLGCAERMAGDQSFSVRMGLARHLAGDQSSSWGYHVDHWFPQRFEASLPPLGFDDVRVETGHWDRPPYLANVTATAVKTRQLGLPELVEQAKALLADSMVDPSEKPTLQVWHEQLDRLMRGAVLPPEVEAAKLPETGAQPPLHEIQGFNQIERDRWIEAKVREIAPDALVVDLGAGTCPYKPLFSTQRYVALDAMRCDARDTRGCQGYGPIDAVSDIHCLPLQDASADVVLCSEVLEHVARPDLVIMEIGRILKPGGTALLTAPLGCGRHQSPHHYYGGFTPEWYRHFLPLAGLEATEITPNGGFLRHLAQECSRVAWTFESHAHLHGENADRVKSLFGEHLPRFLHALENGFFLEDFTVGYFVAASKGPARS
ncbi:MAG: methyltransferase domain-containing protein [Acidobacteriota bacterium]